MRNKLTAMAAAGVLSLCSVAPTYARSVTQPGELVGLATGAPLPPGLYFVNTADWGCANTDPQDTCIGVTIPVVAWSTPWQILGARLQFLFAWPAVEVGVDSTPDVPGVYQAGFYNPVALVQLAWDLGGGWGFSYAIGAYFDNEPAVSWSDTSLNQRIGLSYTGGGWNATANLVYGTHFDSLNTDNLRLVSPCLGRPDLAGFNCNPDFLNLDLTLTKTFGKWEFGPVAFGSWDVSDPANGYQNQSQFAVGGLIGYDFGPVKLQTYVTTDVTQDNYGGYDTRGWTRIIIPLGNPWPTPAPMSRRY
jgi:outer membrane putative beta-barrel porin/alpha-amylase